MVMLITVIVGVFLLALSFGGCAYVGPQYNVWSSQLSGEARYAEAQSSRRIKTLEAKAKLDSATYEAQAEVIRAKGVAQANHIIGKSLQGNEAYLRYLWITNLQENKGERIYIPTEAGMPILEAKH